MRAAGRSGLWLALALWLGAGGAAAQTRANLRPVSAEFRVGASSGSSETGVAVGGAVSVGLTGRFAFEGAGQYFGRGAGERAFTVSGGLLADLVPDSRETVPYLAAGVGWYHSSLDLGNARFFGGLNLGPGVPVCGGGFGPGNCGYGVVPNFYARRLGSVVSPVGRGWPTVGFNDPAVHLGVGARMRLSDHVYVRPDVRVLWVFSGGARQAVSVFTFALGYQR